MSEQLRGAIGLRLRMARVAREISTEVLAQRTGIAVATLNSWENARAMPPADRLARICKVLEVSADWIVGDPDGRDFVLIDTVYEKAALAATSRSVDLDRQLRRFSVVVGPAVIRCERVAAERRIHAVDDHVESLSSC